MRSKIPTLIKKIVPRIVKDRVKELLLSERNEPIDPELARLRKLPRYERTTTTLMGKPVDLLDAEAFLQMHHEIVHEAIYYFDADHNRPYVIDGGANIGISVLYFKTVYPEAQIVAFEPDEDAFALLQRNVENWGLSHVKLSSSALGAAEGRAEFMAEGSYAGRLARELDSTTATVATKGLRPYLNRDVDLLKLNVEGAETEILVDCADLLGNVKRIVLEYHSFAGETQTFHELLSVLADTGYRVYVRSVNDNWPIQPFVNIPMHMGMDLQLYIYAFRDDPLQI